MSCQPLGIISFVVSILKLTFQNTFFITMYSKQVVKQVLRFIITIAFSNFKFENKLFDSLTLLPIHCLKTTIIKLCIQVH